MVTLSAEESRDYHSYPLSSLDSNTCYVTLVEFLRSADTHCHHMENGHQYPPPFSPAPPLDLTYVVNLAESLELRIPSLLADSDDSAKKEINFFFPEFDCDNWFETHEALYREERHRVAWDDEQGIHYFK